ncbi:MAG: MBL fold metallo-hydrolase, partial [Balneolales bacterium]
MLNKAHIDNFSFYSIENGRFKLDGGAMFGVVPKTLWSKQIQPDDLNRIDMAMRSLLIVSNKTNRVYLVDTGAGRKFNEKFTKIYGLDFHHSDMETSLSVQG